jgi:hypothetical protein
LLARTQSRTPQTSHTATVSAVADIDALESVVARVGGTHTVSLPAHGTSATGVWQTVPAWHAPLGLLSNGCVGECIVSAHDDGLCVL